MNRVLDAPAGNDCSRIDGGADGLADRQAQSALRRPAIDRSGCRVPTGDNACRRRGDDRIRRVRHERSLITKSCLGGLLHRQIAENDLVGGFAIPTRQDRDDLGVHRAAVVAQHHRFRSGGVIALAVQVGNAGQHRCDGVRVDEVRDHPAHQVVSAGRGHCPDAGGVDVDHAPVGVNAHGVGAVLQQLPIPLFDGVARHGGSAGHAHVVRSGGHQRSLDPELAGGSRSLLARYRCPHCPHCRMCDRILPGQLRLNKR